jgi:threonine dehydratase
VGDAELLRTLRFLWERMKLVVEPTGALGLAAAFCGKLDVAGKRFGAILSGGNADIPRIAALLGSLPEEPSS